MISTMLHGRFPMETTRVGALFFPFGLEFESSTGWYKVNCEIPILISHIEISNSKDRHHFKIPFSEAMWGVNLYKTSEGSAILILVFRCVGGLYGDIVNLHPIHLASKLKGL